MDKQTKNRRIHELLGKCQNACGECTPNNYCEDIEFAREALAFAVEQKGETAVGFQLARILVRRNAEKDRKMRIVSEAEVLIWTALAPASVLCETALAVLEEK